jgi:hypothetical protein
MRRPVRLLLCASVLAGGFAQEGPRNFQLFLPDFFEAPVDGGRSLIEVPDAPIRTLQILVLDAEKRNISANGIRVRVNGKGAGNILDTKGVDRGLLLTMDPSLLNRRPDEIFDPLENSIEVQATDHRGRVYYQNWIVRCGANHNPYFAYTGAVSPDDPRGVPPDLVLEAPASPPAIGDNQASIRVLLKGRCSSTNPITTVRLNGQQIMSVTETSAPFEYTAEVKRGIKELVLEAIDEKHHRRIVIIPVLTRQKNVVKTHVSGGRYALIVGISQYGVAKDAPPPVPYAAVQARQLALELTEKAGFYKENVRLLVDEQATLPQIRSGLHDFAAKAQGDDLLLIYVAGHALHDPRSGRSDKLYLAPFGTQLSQIESTGLSFEDFEMVLNRSVRANNSFLVFDTGYEVSGDWKFPGRTLVNNYLLNLFSEQQGRSVLVAGSGGEISLAHAGEQSSSFTYWLRRAIAGDADLNGDGVVTAREIFDYISQNVKAETKGSQTPRYRIPQKNADSAAFEIAR